MFVIAPHEVTFLTTLLMELAAIPEHLDALQTVNELWLSLVASAYEDFMLTHFATTARTAVWSTAI